MTSAVMAAMTERKVRYWKTRRKPQSGWSSCSHSARLSSMGTSGEGGNDLFHLHESRTFDQDGRHGGRGIGLGQGRDDVGCAVEMTGLDGRTARGGGLTGQHGARRMGAQAAGRPDVFDAALGRAGAPLLVEGRP